MPLGLSNMQRPVSLLSPEILQSVIQRSKDNIQNHLVDSLINIIALLFKGENLSVRSQVSFGLTLAVEKAFSRLPRVIFETRRKVLGLPLTSELAVSRSGKKRPINREQLVFGCREADVQNAQKGEACRVLPIDAADEANKQTSE
jgi:hypothetical protein